MYINSEHVYFKVERKLDEVMKDVSNYFDLPPSKLRHTHFREYCELALGFEFHPNITGYISQRKLEAFIQFTEVGPMIMYNPNARNTGRVNWSISHEICHALLEHNKTGTQVFSQLINEGGYSYEDKELELEANFGASILMMNTQALEHFIGKECPFNNLCFEFCMSYAALSNRLINYLMFHHGFSYNAANKVVELFKYNEITLKQAINESLDYN